MQEENVELASLLYYVTPEQNQSLLIGHTVSLGMY